MEGKDFEVLKQLQINKLKPDLIAIETHNVDGSETKNFNDIHDYLKKSNFTVYKRVGPTTLFNIIR